MIRKLASSYFNSAHGCEILARKMNPGRKVTETSAHLPVDKRLVSATKTGK